jgi:glucose-1-phosphate cytidylyltransferase
LGYKAQVVKDYFLNYHQLNSDFSVDLSSGKVSTHQVQKADWNLTLVDTGLNTMTGGRVKKMKPYIGNETFMLTYGDGVTNINISQLVDFHKSHGKMVTVSAVHPAARFGEMNLDGIKVSSFSEKPQTTKGWINGGYFVIEPDFFDLIDGDDTILEKTPLEKATEMGELMAFKHDGFWQCMDTKRDRDYLESLWESNANMW